MKITDLHTESNTQAPSELVGELLLHLDANGTLHEFLARYDYESECEVSDAVARVVKYVCLDAFLTSKDVQKNRPFEKAIWTRFYRIYTDQSKFDKFIRAAAAELWNGGYHRELIARRTSELLHGETPNAETFAAVSGRLQRIYSLTDTDMEKLQFFVEQVKAGAAFPNSLRRMLYIWGSRKKTGKTTSATMIVSLLNGESDYRNISEYSTTLTNEMQIKSFSVPRISYCNACLMDECFYADMGKTYSDFKRFLTSSNGTARLPYGQEFVWRGEPNYVATSNDPLSIFIKDWDDRRYLSVEFREQPTENLPFEDIRALWLEFIRNSTPRADFATWSTQLFDASNEKGERETIAEEVEIDLCSQRLLDKIITLSTPNNSTQNPMNRVSLKFFVDYFAETMGATLANKRRREIEKAVLRTFGERYGGQSWWLLQRLQDVAIQIKNNALALPYEESGVDNYEDLAF